MKLASGAPGKTRKRADGVGIGATVHLCTQRGGASFQSISGRPRKPSLHTHPGPSASAGQGAPTHLCVHARPSQRGFPAKPAAHSQRSPPACVGHGTGATTVMLHCGQRAGCRLAAVEPLPAAPLRPADGAVLAPALAGRAGARRAFPQRAAGGVGAARAAARAPRPLGHEVAHAAAHAARLRQPRVPLLGREHFANTGGGGHPRNEALPPGQPRVPEGETEADARAGRGRDVARTIGFKETGAGGRGPYDRVQKERTWAGRGPDAGQTRARGNRTLARAWRGHGAGVARAMDILWLGVARAWRGHGAGVARAPVPPGPDASQTRARRGPDAGQARARRGPDAGQTRARRGPDAGQTRARRGPDAGQARARRGPDAGQTRAASVPPTQREKRLRPRPTRKNMKWTRCGRAPSRFPQTGSRAAPPGFCWGRGAGHLVGCLTTFWAATP
eukprot:gene853-biopygen6184